MLCITKPNRQSPLEHITHLGGQDWKWTREQVIASIDAKTNTLHVIDATGHRSEVVNWTTEETEWLGEKSVEIRNQSWRILGWFTNGPGGRFPENGMLKLRL